MSIELTTEWPYPQTFRNRQRMVVATKEDIIEVDNTDFLLRGYQPLFHSEDTWPSNMVLNGSFTGNATGWTLGAGWAYGDNMVACTAGSADLLQTFVFVAGYTYYIEFMAKVTSGSFVVKAGAVESDPITADGKYRLKLTSDGTSLTFTPTAFTGYLDEIVIYFFSGNIKSGTPWQFVDMGENYMLLNGATTVFKLNGLLFTNSDITINAGCFWRGRVFLGGFDKINFWNADWQSFWASATPDNYTYDLGDVDKNWIMWTSVGGGDLYSLFYPELITAGSKPLIWDYMQRNESGMMPMSWPERVQSTIPLGDGVVVYGQDGITFLKFSAANNTFGKVELARFGINSRGSVAGDELTQVLLANTGEFWMLTADLKLQFLGYQEYGRLLLDQDTVITYNPEEGRPGIGEWHIANNNYSFLLNQFGMSESGRGYTSTNLINGALFGVWQGGDIDETLVRSDSLFFDIAGEKTLAQITVDYTSIDNLTVEAEYRNSKDPHTFHSSRHVPVNKSGVARIGITAEEFRIILRGTTNQRSALTGMQVELQYGDKRFQRGINVSSTRS